MTLVTSSLHRLFCARGICPETQRKQPSGLAGRQCTSPRPSESSSQPSLSDREQDILFPPRAMASWVFAQPVGGGTLTQFLLIDSLICFFVRSTNTVKGRYGARPLLDTRPVTVVFHPLGLGSLVSHQPPFPGCLLHAAFPGLPCVSQKGLGFAVEADNSEISLATVRFSLRFHVAGACFCSSDAPASHALWV